MKNIIAAYAAGLLDGEGTVTLSHLRKGCERVPVVSFSNNSPELIRFFQETFHSTTVRKRVINKEKHAEAWECRLSYDRAIAFLRNVLPFLRHKGKIARANLIVSEYKRLTPRNGKYTPTMLAEKRDFERRFFSIQTRGPKATA